MEYNITYSYEHRQIHIEPSLALAPTRLTISYKGMPIIIAAHPHVPTNLSQPIINLIHNVRFRPRIPRRARLIYDSRDLSPRDVSRAFHEGD